MSDSAVGSPAAPKTAAAADPWRQLSRVTGVAGLVAPVLVLGPISAASGQEPGFTGTAAEVRAFFLSTGGSAHALGSALATVGLVSILWFAVALAVLSARAEGTPAWRSAIAAVSASTFVILNLSGGWEAASYRAAGLTDELALYAFDEGNLTFANSWVAMGSFAAGVGWVVLRARWAPRWLGWMALASGVGLVLVRFAWTGQLWFVPYALFWLWVIALSIHLLRTSRRAVTTTDSEEDVR
jgi:hypothetical protein